MPTPVRYFYSSTAGEYTLQGGVTSGAATLTLDSTVGLPTSFPYTLVVDFGTDLEEIVTVTAAAGPVLTVTRAQDGSAGVAHGFGAKCRHAAVGRDFQQPSDHMAAASAVHGVAGLVVGTTDVQTVSEKTFLAAAANKFAAVFKAASGQTADIAKVVDAAGATIVSFTTSGAVWAGTSIQAFTAAAANVYKTVLSLVSPAPDVVPLKIVADAAQSAALTSWTDSGGTELAAVTAAGAGQFGSVTSAGSGQFGSVTSAGAGQFGSVTSSGAGQFASVTSAGVGQFASVTETAPGAWTSWNPTTAWTATTNPAIGNGTYSGQYRVLPGNKVEVFGRITMGSSTTYGTGSWLFGVPVPLNAAVEMVGLAWTATGATSNVAAALRSGSGFRIWPPNTASPAAATIPVTWVSGNVLYFWLSYQGA